MEPSCAAFFRLLIRSLLLSCRDRALGIYVSDLSIVLLDLRLITCCIRGGYTAEESAARRSDSANSANNRKGRSDERHYGLLLKLGWDEESGDRRIFCLSKDIREQPCNF